jgi:hypothetical protein
VGTTIRTDTAAAGRSSPARRALLAEGPIHVGTGWADDLCAQIVNEGRLLAGGWPGTMTEARARARYHLDVELARRSMPSLTSEELATATRTTYARARQVWLNALFAAQRGRKRRRRVKRDEE